MSVDESSKLRKALRAIVTLREQLASEQYRKSEPIAVVSMACRFPGGVTTPEQLWEMLAAGRDVVTEIPKSRFDIEPLFNPDTEKVGTSYTRWGGFVGDVDGLDAPFFGMSPREAKTVDPQERLLLETSWELFERGGYLPDQLAGSKTGVYVGISANEYLTESGMSHDAINAYSLLGTAHSAVVGRISYWLGLEGPNFPVDTACSSSIVGIHLACQGLRNGDCDMAVAGGVNLLLSSYAFVYFSRLRAMSPTGRCHTFSSDADGYVRAEGCGLVLLKRLSDAERDGDDILAVIRGTALNQDGHSNGFTAPNGPAQQAVIRKALGVAGLDPKSIDYVECHGTGTPLGDPIEVQALAAVYGEGRAEDRPVVIGSIKSNMGHAESAAGIGSVMKAILALQHHEIPKTLHVGEPNPRIPWDDLPVTIAVEPVPWSQYDTPRRVGVSSFGFSGTNGHVVLEEAPEKKTGQPEDDTQVHLAPEVPLLISARNQAALRAQARRWADWLDANPEACWDSVRYTAACHRAHFESRGAVTADGVSNATELLRTLAEGKTRGGVVSHDGEAADQVAFLFTGQGSQQAQMGLELYETLPAYREAFDAILVALNPHLPQPLESVLFAEKGSELAQKLHETQWTQPALFAFELALATVWRQRGMKPSFVLGHSIGELVAAQVAGVMSLEDAAKLVCARGRLMQSCQPAGAMLSLQCDEAQVSPWVQRQGGKVDLAGLNSPKQTVISGDEDGVRAIESLSAQAGIKTTRLQVSHAFHSHHMDTMLDAYHRVAESCTLHPPRIPLVSNVTGQLASDEELTSADYWVSQVRSAVRFVDCMQTLEREGVSTFIECGPRGVLCAMGAACVARDTTHFVASHRKGRSERATFMAAMAKVHVLGHALAWDTLLGGATPHRVALPTYAFQRKRYWLDRVEPTPTKPKAPVSSGAMVERVLEPSKQPYLLRHRLGPQVILSSAMILDLICGAVAEVSGHSDFSITALRFERPIVLAAGGKTTIKVEVLGGGRPGSEVLCHAQAGGEIFAVHARGRIDASLPRPASSSLDTILARCSKKLAVDELVDAAKARGYGLACFANLVSGWEGPAEILLETEIPGGASAGEGWAGLAEVSDAIPLAGGALQSNSDDALALPTIFGRSMCWGSATGKVWFHGQLSDSGNGVTVRLLGSDGDVLAISEDVAFEAIGDWSKLPTPVAIDGGTELWAPDGGVVVAGDLNRVDRETLEELLAPSDRELTCVGVRGTEDILRSRLADHPEISARTRLMVSSDAFETMANGHAPRSVVWFEPAEEPGGDRMDELEVLWRLHRASIGWACSDFSVILPRRGRPGSPASLFLDELGRHRDDSYLPFKTSLWARDPQSLPMDPPPLAQSQQPVDTSGTSSSLQSRTGLLHLVRDALGAVLDSDLSDIHGDTLFSDMGFDSLVGVEFRNKINAETGLELSAAMAYDYPTPSALADHLAALLGVEDEVEPEQVATAVVPVESVGGTQEPIAIVSMACRLPGGVESPEDYWRLLASGRDAIEPFPTRYQVDALYDPDPEAAGKTTCREGGFLRDVERFDAAFFGISPKEALAMDPQQRQVLEVAWEALERAGIQPASLEQSMTGVYIGSIGSDYTVRSLESLTGYQGTGTLLSVISGRLAYSLGLHGPAMTVDTACSSSLVALDLACTALRRGDCSMALAGGVQVMSTPITFVEFSRLRGLAPDGRCKSFGAGANGTGWAEGVGILVLKRLAQAEADGDEVLALIRGSAVNQDGRSQGLTAPNGPSQARVIRRALEQSGLEPNDIDYLETHGTGTSLGDPIEAGALADVFGPDRREEHPLYLGASKSNLGHSQAAAGVVSVMKGVLSLQNETMAKTLHADEPSPHIKWEGSGLCLTTEQRSWPRCPDHIRRLGVSSFGLSGTNAHLILEEAPSAGPEDTATAMPWDVPLLISARDDAGLRAQARRWARWCRENTEVSWGDLVYTAALKRTHHYQRALVRAQGAAEVAEALDALALGQPHPALQKPRDAQAGKLAFLFTGQGSQTLKMGKRLYENDAAYRASFDAIVLRMDRLLERPLTSVLFAKKRSEEAGLLDETAYTQPALFALEVSLFRAWEARGVRPDRLMGHSIGELAAAHVAGVMSLDDAVTMVCARGRLMQACKHGGAMVSLAASEGDVQAELDQDAGRMSIAGLNGPMQTVISGDEDAVSRVARKLEERGVKTTRLTVSHAFHSPHMDSMLDAFREVVASCVLREPQLPIVSNVTGKYVQGGQMTDPAYWVRQVRSAVRFTDGMQTLSSDGVTAFVELGPCGVLCAMGASCLSDDPRATFIPSIRKGRDELTTLSQALGQVHLVGHRVDWLSFFETDYRLCVSLPTYAFQGERYWIEDLQGGPRGLTDDSPDRDLWDAVAGADLDEVAEVLGLHGSAREGMAALLPQLATWRRQRDSEAELARWLYTDTWELASSAPTASGDVSGTWVLVAPEDSSGCAAVIEAALIARGARVVCTAQPLIEVPTDLRGVVALTAFESGGAEVPLPAGIGSGVALIRSLLAQPGQAPLWFVTQGAVAAEPSDQTKRPLQALTWGLARVMGLEHPDRYGGVVDLPEELGPDSAQRLVDTLISDDQEDQVALRSRGRLVRRLVRRPRSTRGSRWSPRGTVLVTGGTGALGAHTAKWLVAQGAEHLVLTSRRGLEAPGSKELLHDLQSLGAGG